MDIPEPTIVVTAALGPNEGTVEFELALSHVVGISKGTASDGVILTTGGPITVVAGMHLVRKAFQEFARLRSIAPFS